jgi:hypothetical protein
VDIDVFASGIAADESGVIDGIKHLAGPVMAYDLQIGDKISGPSLHSLETRHCEPSDRDARGDEYRLGSLTTCERGAGSQGRSASRLEKKGGLESRPFDIFSANVSLR